MLSGLMTRRMRVIGPEALHGCRGGMVAPRVCLSTWCLYTIQVYPSSPLQLANQTALFQRFVLKEPHPEAVPLADSIARGDTFDGLPDLADARNCSICKVRMWAAGPSVFTLYHKPKMKTMAASHAAMCMIGCQIWQKTAAASSARGKCRYLLGLVQPTL